jgi:hypothetical protein
MSHGSDHARVEKSGASSTGLAGTPTARALIGDGGVVLDAGGTDVVDVVLVDVVLVVVEPSSGGDVVDGASVGGGVGSPEALGTNAPIRHATRTVAMISGRRMCPFRR